MKSSGGRAQGLTAENLSDDFNVYRRQDDANITNLLSTAKYMKKKSCSSVIEIFQRRRRMSSGIWRRGRLRSTRFATFRRDSATGLRRTRPRSRKRERRGRRPGFCATMSITSTGIFRTRLRMAQGRRRKNRWSSMRLRVRLPMGDGLRTPRRRVERVRRKRQSFSASTRRKPGKNYTDC